MAKKLVTVPRGEYLRLQRATRALQRLLGLSRPAKTATFRDAAFGALKKSYGRQSSVSYVASLRKTWR